MQVKPHEHLLSISQEPKKSPDVAKNEMPNGCFYILMQLILAPPCAQQVSMPSRP